MAIELHAGASQVDHELLDDIMKAGQHRDADADARDDLADQRDMNAARAGTTREEFDARTEAAADRMDAKIDRVAARRDRERLSRLYTVRPRPLNSSDARDDPDE